MTLLNHRLELLHAQLLTRNATVTLAAPQLLRARALAFHRDDVPVFGPLDLHVDEGEVLLVRGSNGAGKTTLLRVLAGLSRADGGELEHASTPEGVATCAWLGHLHGHKGDLTARENLQLDSALAATRHEISVDDALDVVGLGLEADQLARHLSAGQKKRLSLARTWRSAAALWLLDEPYANLDLDGIAIVNQLIGLHIGRGGGAVITSHGAYATPPVPTRTLALATP